MQTKEKVENKKIRIKLREIARIEFPRGKKRFSHDKSQWMIMTFYQQDL